MVQFFIGLLWALVSVGVLLAAHARLDSKGEIVRYAVGAGALLGSLIGWAWCAEATGAVLSATTFTLAAVGIAATSGTAVWYAHEADKEALRAATRRQMGYQPPTEEDL